MRAVRWKLSARAQFRRLLDYIDDRNPVAAEQFEADFEERIARLAERPGIGRPGRTVGTREFILHPNYIAVYQVRGDEVFILRVFHARQRYP